VAEVAEELLTIDLRLQFALFGLECALGVSFAGAERVRVFRDAAEDQVSAKRYTFFESPRLNVTGRVDEYEPESIWLRVEGGRGCGEALRRVAEGSKFAEFRRRGRTILLVTHSLGLVERFCDEAVWLDRGRVAGEGDPRRIVDAYLTAVERSEEELMADTTAKAVAAATDRDRSAEPTGYGRVARSCRYPRRPES